MRAYDAVVLGLGGMGSAAVAHLARRKKRVIGLEQFELGHDFGASSGRTRVIRKAYFEGLDYVPLLDRSYELWRELELQANVQLLDLIGTLMVSRSNGSMLDGVRECIQQYGVKVVELRHQDVRARYPTVRLDAEDICLFEPNAGIVYPEIGILAHQEVARRNGALLRGGVCVKGWQRTPHDLKVELSDGSIIQTEHLILCAGAWLGNVCHDLDLPIVVQRNVQIWFAPTCNAYTRAAFPTFFLERDGLPKPLYGFPDLGDGVKAALHGYGEATTPEELDRAIHEFDVAAVSGALNAFLPGAAGEFRFGKVCMYAMTPDEHFLIDRHPHDDGVIIVGGFSGHGYKFCPAIGEIVADLVDGKARPDIDFLRLRRFEPTQAPR